MVAKAVEENCYILISDQKQAVVVDPGVMVVERVAQVLAERGAELAAVLLTHTHADHCWDAAAVSELKPGSPAPVYVPAPDRYRLDDPAAYLPFQVAPDDYPWVMPADIQDIPAPLWSGNGGEIIPGLSLRALAAPGHSEGSTVFYGYTPALDHGQKLGVEGEEPTKWMLSGDVIFRNNIGRLDLPGSDPDVMEETLRTLVRCTDPETVILPGHNYPTTMAHEIANNLRPYTSPNVRK